MPSKSDGERRPYSAAYGKRTVAGDDVNNPTATRPPVSCNTSVYAG